MEMKFYKCKHCGKIIAIVDGCSTCPTICCGEPMQEMVPNTEDGAVEKHIPVYEVKDNVVYIKVGSVAHPMVEAHYIKWIVLCTNYGNQRKLLSPDSEPKAEFLLLDGEVVNDCLAYCNLHGLWKA